MGFAIRFLAYLGVGGALLAWLQPSRGLLEVAAIGAWIGFCVFVDTSLERIVASDSKSLSLKRKIPGGSRTRDTVAHGWDRDSRKRRGMRVLFESTDLEHAEFLSMQLRDRGFHPILVSQTAQHGTGELIVQLSLPETEYGRAQSIVSRLSAKRAES